MYQNQDIFAPYYILDLWHGRCVAVCPTFDNLIATLARGNRFIYVGWDGRTVDKNEYVADYNCTGKDTTVYDETQQFLKQWMVVDTDGHIIDIRRYADAIQNYVPPKKVYRARYWRYEKDLPLFRQGPVPMTGKLPRCRLWRYPRTANEIRQNSKDEYKEYVRPSRRHLPTVRDDIRRDTQKSWKEQSKKRKQWM